MSIPTIKFGTAAEVENTTTMPSATENPTAMTPAVQNTPMMPPAVPVLPQTTTADSTMVDAPEVKSTTVKPPVVPNLPPVKDYLRVKSSNARFSFEICSDDQFENGQNNTHIKWEHYKPRSQQFGYTWDFKPMIEFQAKTTTIVFKEAFFQIKGDNKFDQYHRVAGEVSIALADLEPVQIVEEGASDNPTLRISSSLKEGKFLKPSFEETCPSAFKRYEGPLLLLSKLHESQKLSLAKHIRIRIHDIHKNKTVNKQMITRILHGEGHMTLPRTAQHFIDMQNWALKKESDQTMKELNELVRTNCSVHLYIDPKDPKQLIAHIKSTKPRDIWDLQTDHKLILKDKTIFDMAPGRDSDGMREWTATVFDVAEAEAYAVVGNIISDLTPYHDKKVEGVHCLVAEQDPMGPRLNEAVKKANICLRGEMGQFTEQEKYEHSHTSLRIPLSRLFIQHKDFKPVEGSSRPFVLKNGQYFCPSTFVLEDKYGLKESHKTFIRTVFANKGSISAAHGPPGTGKTTLLAKTAIIVDQKSSRYNEKIVLCAHSNQATRVLLKRMHDESTRLGIPLLDKMVYVQSEKVARRSAKSGNPLEPELHQYVLENQIMRVAKTNMIQFGSYVDFHAKYKAGEQLTKDDLKSYSVARMKVMQEIRKKFTFFVCTMSMVNTRFFIDQLSKKTRVFECFMVMIDEVSQVAAPAYFEVVIALNPRHIVLGGDHEQLPCFTKTNLATNIWAESPISHAARLGKDFCTLLDVQFRMPAHIYLPTNRSFYKSLVKTADPAGGAVKEKQLLKALENVYMDALGDGNWQTLNSSFVIFDVYDTKSYTYGVNSSANDEEAAVVESFLQCLKAAGVPARETMALTPYQGQYKNLKLIKERLETPDLAVRKIDSSQGDERAVVVFSATSTNRIGFMGSSNRLNVATSRQQAGFFAFCKMGLFNGDTNFSGDPHWKRWINAVSSNPHPGVKYHKVSRKCRFSYRSPSAPQVVSQDPDKMDTAAEGVVTPAKPPMVEDLNSVFANQVLNEPTLEIPGPAMDLERTPQFANKRAAARFHEVTKVMETWSHEKRQAASLMEAASGRPPFEFNEVINESKAFLSEEELKLVSERIELLKLEE